MAYVLFEITYKPNNDLMTLKSTIVKKLDNEAALNEICVFADNKKSIIKIIHTNKKANI